MIKRIKKPTLTGATTTTYTTVAAKAAAAIAVAATVIRIKRIFIRIKILNLEK